MKKTTLWLRLLAVLLVCGLMLGCLAGCDDTGSSGGSGGKSGSSQAKKLREGLEEYEKDGLLLYFGEEMIKDGYSFHDEDYSMSVYSSTYSPDDLAELEDDVDMEITSAKTMMEAFLASIEDSESFTIHDSGKKNGAYYVDYEWSYDGETDSYILGVYYQDGYGWLVDIRFENEDQKETAIEYATICQVDPDFDAEDYNDDYEDEDYDEDYDYEYEYEYEYDDYY